MTTSNTTKQEDCLFCKIIAKKIPASIIYEDEDLIAFKDIHPKADIHFLIVPKQHISMLSDCTVQHAQILGKMLYLSAPIASSQGANNGFKTTIHNGSGGGQEIFHLHMHVMANIIK